MNSAKKIITVLSTIALSIGFALPAAAETSLTGMVTTATNATVDAQGSGSNAYGNSDTSVNVGVGASGSASGSSNSGTTSSSSSSSGTQGSTNVSNDNSASADATASDNLDVTPLIITRADLDAKSVTPTSADATSVHSDSDLSGYVAAQLQGDSNISQVETAGDSVAVTYAQHAKLFGFIPVTVNATAKVNANGSVTVSYPWYAFFASTNKSDLQAKLQDRVNADLKGSGSASANASASTNTTAKLSADEQARLIADVKAAMQDEINAQANASADASGSANTQY